MRHSQLWRILSLAYLLFPAHLFAQFPLEFSLPRSGNQDFAQMLLFLEPDYKFQYERVQEKRLLDDQYLVAAVPVIPAFGPLPTDEAYFKTQRPAVGLVTAFRYEPPVKYLPVENVIFMSQLKRPGILEFWCELFSGGQHRPNVCAGNFRISAGTLEFERLETLFQRTENQLRAQPKEKCVDQLYRAVRKEEQCVEQSFLIWNFRCSIISHLYARHICTREVS